LLDHTNARNGPVADNSSEDSACSIAATGLGLSCYPVAVNNGWLKREDAAERVLIALRFFEHSPQGPEPYTTMANCALSFRSLFHWNMPKGTGTQSQSTCRGKIVLSI
jgi:hypothetical protein